MIRIISYGSGKFLKYQSLLGKSLSVFARRAEFIDFNSSIKQDAFFDANKEISEIRLGDGLWLWKPYIIYNNLKNLAENDWLIYIDSAMICVRDLTRLIPRIDQDITAFYLPFLEKDYTSSSVLESCGDIEKNGLQISASLIILRKSKQSLEFCSKWLEWCADYTSLSGGISKEYIEESKCFHRHDQSLFSILFKRYNYTAYRDISQLGKHWQSYYNGNLVPNDVNLLMKSVPKLDNSIYLYHYRDGNGLKMYIKFLVKKAIGLKNVR